MKTPAYCLMLAGSFLVPPHAAAQASPQLPVPATSEMVEIDGGKNPEMIPQWSAWEFAFRVFGGGSKVFPLPLREAVSKEESAVIVGEAVESQKREAACKERLLALRPLVQTADTAEINRRHAEIQIDCRWQTLHARDRLLERLKPAGRTALIEFVESTKAGIHVTIAKHELAHYRQPQ